MVHKHAWKKRSLYGNQLLKKIKKISNLLNKELDTDPPDVQVLAHYSKMYGYLTMIQLSNISKIEEFDMMEIMDRYNEREKAIREIPRATIDSTSHTIIR